MANTKIVADGKALTVWWAPVNYAANWRNPTAAELNAALDITEAIAWDGYSFGPSASNQTSDPSLLSVGNSQSRGLSQFGGTIPFFYPSSYVASTTDKSYLAFAALRTPGTFGYIIIRQDGQKTTGGVADVNKAAVNGDIIDVYRVQTDAYSDNDTGENSYKYLIGFLPQGNVAVNAFVGTVTVATPTAVGTAAYTVGGKTPLASSISSRLLHSTAGQYIGTPSWLEWSSSSPAVATVDRNGVVRGLSAGSTNIIATHAGTGVASTALAVTIA